VLKTSHLGQSKDSRIRWDLLSFPKTGTRRKEAALALR
jgi:hypothetical protein